MRGLPTLRPGNGPNILGMESGRPFYWGMESGRHAFIERLKVADA